MVTSHLSYTLNAKRTNSVQTHPRRHLSCLGVCAVNEHTYLNIPVYWWLSIQKARLSGGLHEHFTRYFLVS